MGAQLNKPWLSGTLTCHPPTIHWFFFAGSKYAGYEFPAMIDNLCFGLSFISVLCIPVVAVIQCIRYRHIPFVARLRLAIFDIFESAPG